MANKTDKLINQISDLCNKVSNFSTEVKKLTDALNGNGNSGGSGKTESNDDLKKYFSEERERNKLMREFSEATSLKKESWQDRQREKYIKAKNDKEKEKIIKSTKAGNITSMVSGIIGDVGKQITEMAVKMKEYEIKAQKINLDATMKTAKIQMQLTSQGIQNALSTATGGLVNSIQENSAQSLKSALELGKQFMVSNVEKAQISMSKSIDIQTNRLRKEQAIINSTASSISGGLQSVQNPYTQAAGALVSLTGSILSATKETEIMKLEFKKESIEKVSEFNKDVLEQSKNLVSQFTDLSTSIDKTLMELDTEAHNIARMVGLGETQTELYVKTSATLNKEMATVGKSFQDLAKMQNAYILQSDRNRIMSGREGTMIASLGKLFNITDEESAQIVGAMNIFNTSIESGSDMMFDMYKIANKMGVSNQKFAKDMQKNLKLAEKYQFKGGVEGMMKMSLWAQKVRFNMDSLSSALEKMHTGNIEDVIQTSARLNVLGGNAAVLSDPMAMLYNAYADPAQYAKNIQRMIAGFGTFDNKTGETVFNINEQFRMEAMASALGMSKEDFFNMARQEKKASRIKGMLGNRFDEAETGLIAQNATYNRENKTWEVNVMGKNGEVISKDITSLSKDDLKTIFPEDNQEQLVEYTKRIFGILEENLATELGNKSELMERTQESHRKNYEERRRETRAHYMLNMDEYATEVIDAFDFSTNAMRENYKLTEEMFAARKEGESLTEQYYKVSLAGIQSLVDNVVPYTQYMKELMNPNPDYDKLIEYANKIAPDMVEYLQTTKEQKQLEDKVNKIIESGIDRETWLNMSRDERDFVLDKYDVDNMTRVEQALKMRSGQMVIQNGTIQSSDGKYYKTKNNALNNPFNSASEEERAYSLIENPLVWWGLTAFGGIPGMIASGVGINYRTNRANDLIISPKHGIFKLDPEDTITASKPGGSLDRAERRRGGMPENVNLNINGTLRLDSGRQSIDLMEVLRNDPNALRELAREIIVEGSKTTFGGRHIWAPNRYTFNN